MSETSGATSGPKRRSDMKTIPCLVPGCGKFFNRQARLDGHMRKHKGETPFKCQYANCDKAYPDKKYLNSHIKSAHLKVARFVCDECGRGFATGQRLQRHEEAHATAEKFRCRDYPPCEETFRKRKTLDRHILKVHLGKKPFACEEDGCGESYATLNALKAHTQRDHGDDMFFCGPCSEKVRKDPSLKDEVECSFRTQVQLELHIRQKHVNCVHCGDGIPFAGQYELERHIDLYHSGQTVKDRKVVACEHEGCEKRFVKRSNMLAHYRTAHEGFRWICGKVDTSQAPGLETWDWKVEGCGQQFTTKVGATEHALYIHLGLDRTPWEGLKGYSEPQQVHSILDEVSGVTDLERRPVKCPAGGCNARFARYADMDKHVATMHTAVADHSPTPQGRYTGGLDGQDDHGSVPQDEAAYGHGQDFGTEGPVFGQRRTAIAHIGAFTDGTGEVPEQQHLFPGDQDQLLVNQDLKQEEEMDIMRLVDFDQAIDPRLLGN